MTQPNSYLLIKPPNIIPSVARATTSYQEFCKLIAEKLIDTQYCIRSLLLKIEKEYHILNTVKTLNARDKKVINDYLQKLELEIVDMIKIRDELIKLKNNESAMRSAFISNKN